MRYNDIPMNNNKKFPVLIAVIALILSGCACHKQASSSIVTSSSSDVSTSETISPSSQDDTSSDASSTTSSSAPESSSQIDEDPNWKMNLSLRGAEFRNALQTIVAGKQTRTTDYSSCLSIGALVVFFIL